MLMYGWQNEASRLIAHYIREGCIGMQPALHYNDRIVELIMVGRPEENRLGWFIRTVDQSQNVVERFNVHSLFVTSFALAAQNWLQIYRRGAGPPNRFVHYFPPELRFIDDIHQARINDATANNLRQLVGLENRNELFQFLYWLVPDWQQQLNRIGE